MRNCGEFFILGLGQIPSQPKHHLKLHPESCTTILGNVLIAPTCAMTCKLIFPVPFDEVGGGGEWSQVAKYPKITCSPFYPSSSLLNPLGRPSLVSSRGEFIR